MAESISKGLDNLNRADLSALMKRLAAARAEAEKAFKASGQNPTATAAPAGLDLAELERAQRTAAPN